MNKELEFTLRTDAQARALAYKFSQPFRNYKKYNMYSVVHLAGTTTVQVTAPFCEGIKAEDEELMTALVNVLIATQK